MKPQRKKSRILAIAVPLLVLAIGVVLAAYFVSSRPKARAQDSALLAQAVNVVVAERDTTTPTINNFGEVVAGREAELRSMVAGRLVFIAEQVQDGAVVTAGTKIAEIDSFEFELAVQQASANLSEAEARLQELRSDLTAEKKLLTIASEQIDLRRRDYERSVDLVNKGQTSKKSLDDAEVALNAAKEAQQQRSQSAARAGAKIAQQQAAITRLQAALAQAQRDLQDTAIIAPFNGYLTDTEVALGKRLSVGESIGRLISSDDLQARFQLNNDDYARLISQGRSDTLLGREVAVGWRLGDSLLTYNGRIERRAAEIDPGSGGVVVYARITGARDKAPATDALRPGAFIEVALPDINYVDVVALPEEALVDGNRIFTVVGDTLQSVRVEVIRRLEEKILVRGDIGTGDSVVITPFATIGPGVRVRVLTE